MSRSATDVGLKSNLQRGTKPCGSGLSPTIRPAGRMDPRSERSEVGPPADVGLKSNPQTLARWGAAAHVGRASARQSARQGGWIRDRSGVKSDLRPTVGLKSNPQAFILESGYQPMWVGLQPDNPPGRADGSAIGAG